MSVLQKGTLSNNQKKFACFDLDWTLIKPKGKSVFPKSTDDYVFMEEVINGLIRLVNEGWSIVIFSNQSGTKWSDDMYYERLNIIYDDLYNKLHINHNLIIYMSRKSDINRKPFSGMWNLLRQEIGDMVFEDSSIFYSGDAFEIGNRKLKASDFKFAYNQNVTFVYPLVLFEKIKKGSLTIDSIILSSSPSSEEIDAYKVEYSLSTCSSFDSDILLVEEMKKKYKYIMLISPPSSGKSSFCKDHLNNYCRLSKDDYKTVKAYRTEILESICNGCSIVIDNTNGYEKHRSTIIDIFNSAGIETKNIGYIIRDVNKQDSIYLNNYRHSLDHINCPLLPDICIHVYFKNVVFPTDNFIKIGHTIRRLNVVDILL